MSTLRDDELFTRQVRSVEFDRQNDIRADDIVNENEKAYQSIIQTIKNKNPKAAIDIIQNLEQRNQLENVLYVDQRDEKPTPLRVAVQENQLEIVKCLLKYASYREREFASDYASKNNYTEIVNFIKEQAVEEERRDELSDLSYSIFPLLRDSFITIPEDDKEECEQKILQENKQKVLQIKSITLLMEYFARKDKNPCYNGYVADSTQALMHAFETLIKAKNGVRFSVIYRNGPHYVSILCEKINNYYHITLQDSIGKEEHKKFQEETIQELISEGFRGKLEWVVLNQNKESRQTTDYDCGYFAVKDVRKMLKTRSSEFFSLHLEKGNHVLKSYFQKSGLKINEYRNPAEFMRLVQSMKLLEKYKSNYPDEAVRILRRNKPGEDQNLELYALQQRNKYGVVTPFLVPSEGPVKQKIQNRSISYFAAKYLYIIEKMIMDTPQERLKEIIDTYNAGNLRVSADGQVRTELQENIFIKQAELKNESVKENIKPNENLEMKAEVPSLVAKLKRAKALLSSLKKRKELDSDSLSDLRVKQESTSLVMDQKLKKEIPTRTDSGEALPKKARIKG